MQQTAAKTVEEILKGIELLDLEPIKFKATHPAGDKRWPREYAEYLAAEYKKFLVLMVKYPEKTIAPTNEVDEFWHLHILDTRKYAADCEQVFGYFLHHYPYFGMRSEQDAKDLERAGETWNDLYASEFGAQPRQGDAAFCFAAVQAKAERQPAFCFAAADAKKPAFCFAALDAKKPAFCFAAVGAKARNPAFCFAAVDAKALDPAFCFAAVDAQKPAFCFAAVGASAKDPAFCFAAVDASKPAFCFAAVEAKKPAFCFAAVDAKAQDPAFCFAAIDARKPAFCFAAVQNKAA